MVREVVVNMASSRSTGGGTILASGIRTRERKERKLYSDDWALGDEEIEGHQTFDLEQKIKSDNFDSCFVKDMTNVEYNLKHVQKHGFNWPLLFKDKAQLGITIPGSEFTINDVRLCVGSRRMLDVMDVNTQKNVEMTMKDWQRYFESQDKDKLLNVISLEFSHTKLEQLVQAPTVVRQIDWVERVWPRHLKEAQTEATNVLEDMMYPKVQKYCLMSVGGCYTDFHIDFGGTSVWYHILRGKKIFWLIPPTERNFQLYEQWVLSGKQSDIFFGDTVDRCARIELEAGNTFFIPTGWIHAVYTPEDSLVFGGNFLHSFGIEKQLRVAQVEDATHVPQKFRYPFFTEMLWYVLERYVHVLLGRTHLSLPPEEEEKYKKFVSSKSKTNNNNQLKEVKEEEKETKPDPDLISDSETKENENESGEEHIHLTQYELHGLKAIVMYLHALPTSKKCVPDLITDPIALIRDVRTVVEKHRYDVPEKSLTSKPVLEWWTREPARFGWKRPLTETTPGAIKKKRRNSEESSGRIVGLPPNVAKLRHRRIRCKTCDPCTRDDCQKCAFCRDMTKYGGPGSMKQSCKEKKCLSPMLPAAAVCYECELDGWNRSLDGPASKPPPKPPSNVPNSLFECCVCYKVSHLSCLVNKFKNVEGIVNEDLPNSWECPECVKEGYNKYYKHNRVPSSRASGAGSDTGEPKTPSVLSDPDDADIKVKIEPEEEGSDLKKSDMARGKIKEEVKEELGGEEQPKEERNKGRKKKGKKSGKECQFATCDVSIKMGDPHSLCVEHAPCTKEGLFHPCGMCLPALRKWKLKRDQETVDTAPPHMPTWEELQARVNRPLVRPMWVVRPNPPLPDEEEDDDEDDEDSGSDGESRPPAREPVPPPMNRSVMLPVFRHLPVNDLRSIMLVCKTWAQWSIHPSLWKTIKLTQKKIQVNHLMGIVRRQPSCLDLSWSRLTKEQLSWVLARLPQLRELHLEGQSWQVISCLTSPYCPPLSILNISYCEGIIDATLTALLSSPRNHRPGHRDTTTRLKQLTDLRLAGTQIGDEGVCSIVRSLPFLTALNLSSCLHITETTAALLAHSSSVVSHSLSSLDLRGCHCIAPTCLPSLKCLPLLTKLAIHPCSKIPLKALKVWGKHHGYTLGDGDILTRAPRPPPDPTDDHMSDTEISSLSRSPSPVDASETKDDQEDSKEVKKLTDDKGKEKVGNDERGKNDNVGKSPQTSDEPPAKKLRVENSESKVSDIEAKDKTQSSGLNKKEDQKPETSGARDKSKNDGVQVKLEKSLVKEKLEKTAKEISEKTAITKEKSERPTNRETVEKSAKEKSEKPIKEKLEKTVVKDEHKNIKDKSESNVMADKTEKRISVKSENIGGKGKGENIRVKIKLESSNIEGKSESSAVKVKSEKSSVKVKSENIGVKEKSGNIVVKDKLENTIKGATKESTKSSNESQDMPKTEAKKTEVASSPSGSIRISTRRQSRLQEGDSDSNSNLSESDKANEQSNKKAQVEIKRERITSPEQAVKKIKISLTDSPKGNSSQEKNKEKLGLKDSSSILQQGHKKEVKASTTGTVREVKASTTGTVREVKASTTGTVREVKASTTGTVREVKASTTGTVREVKASTTGTVKKEASHSNSNEKEKHSTSHSQGKSISTSRKEENRKVSPISLARNIKPLTISCTRTDRLSSEILKKEINPEINRKEEAQPTNSKKESNLGTKPAVDNKRESHALNRSNIYKEEKSSKKSSLEPGLTKLSPSGKGTLEPGLTKVSPSGKGTLEPGLTKVSLSGKDTVSKERSSTETLRKLVSEKKQKSIEGSSSSAHGPLKKRTESLEQVSEKIVVSSDESNKNTSVADMDKKKSSEKKATTPVSKTSDTQMNQKNVIVTSVEVHRADNYDSAQDADGSGRRPERRLSVRKSKDEADDKPEKNEKATADSVKDKRRDSRSREEEMNKITVEDSQDKDLKSSKKRLEEKDKKSPSSKKITLKQNYPLVVKIKQEKDIVTRSTKRLKTEKEMEEKQTEQPKEDTSPKLIDKSSDLRKNIRKSKEFVEDKEELTPEEGDKKDIKSPKPLTTKKEREPSVLKTFENKKEEDKTVRRSRSDAEEYMSKLRRKSHDSDGSNDSPSLDPLKKEENADEKIRSRRRSVKDDDTTKSIPEKKSREESKEEKKSEISESRLKEVKATCELESTSKLSKRKSEDADESEPNKKIKEDTEAGKAAKKPSETMRERSGSRERPERAHRSPRRLSMCQ